MFPFRRDQRLLGCFQRGAWPAGDRCGTVRHVQLPGPQDLYAHAASETSLQHRRTQQESHQVLPGRLIHGALQVHQSAAPHMGTHTRRRVARRNNIHRASQRC